MSEKAPPTTATGYPLVFRLLLVAMVPVGFVACALAAIAALPVGNLAYRSGAGVAIALVPVFLGYRASSALRRRGTRGFLRAPLTLLLVMAGYVAIVGALYQWRGLTPPHLVSTADHLSRAFLFDEEVPPLEVVAPKLPLQKIYDRALPPFDEAERMLSQKTRTSDEGGFRTMEVWSVETGALRHRFTGERAAVSAVRFIDDRRVVALRNGGRALILDAEAGTMIHELIPPAPLGETVVLTSTNGRMLITSGRLLEGAEFNEVHTYDLETGRTVSSVTGVLAFGVSPDFTRLVTVEKKKTLTLVCRHLPSGELEAAVPAIPLISAKGKKIAEVEHVEVIVGGKQVLIFTKDETHLFDLTTRKAVAFPLAGTKLYPYGVAPGGRAYFHRRTDASDPRPTGLFRLPSGEKLLELETRGQPPTATFTPDGRFALVDTAVFSTVDGRLVGGARQPLYTLVRDQWFVTTLDGSAILEPDRDSLAVKTLETRLAKGRLPRRGDEHGSLSKGGQLYVVRARHLYAEDSAVLARLASWKPDSN